MEGGLLAGLRPHPRADSGSLLQEELHLVSKQCTPSSPRKTVQNTDQSSIWEAASYQPVMGATFCFPISILVSTKEFRVPSPKITFHLRVSRATSNPSKG